MRELLYIAGAQHHIHVGPCCGSKEARRSRRRGDAIRSPLTSIPTTFRAVNLIAATGVKRLAAGAHHALAVHLSHVFSAPSCRVFGFLRSFLQPAGNGVLQALGEAVVHAKESLEGPSTRDLVSRLTMSVSGPVVQMRRPAD